MAPLRSAPPFMTGLLLINLGTPRSPTTGDVRRYLREFLSDPHVIDIHPLARWLLLHLVILPRRPTKSAAAYRQIWTTRGSPLLCHSEDLCAALRTHLGEGWLVELAMRYGEPAIADGLARLRDAGADPVVVVPLYPQHATSSTTTSIEAVRAAAARLGLAARLIFVGAFYDDPRFVAAFAASARPVLSRTPADHVLFSFHGLPERHIRRLDATGAHCLASAACCDRIGDANRLCYRAHAFATARALAHALALAEDAWSVSFQSRLGRTPWIQPYTDQVIPALARRGVRRLVVLCPAFVADCLETLEEIGIRARADFVAAGGTELALVPSLNSSPAWVDTLAGLAREARDA
jgi:ferrochelatase